MSDEVFKDIRYFLATSGVKLPLKLVNRDRAEGFVRTATPIFAPGMTRPGCSRELVYGDIEMSHGYSYDEFGVLRRAEILMLDEDPTVLEFNGAPA